MLSSSRFKPAWWLPGPHLQTIWSPLLRRPLALTRQRERVTTTDGDFIDLDWYNPQKCHNLALILHGLTGNSNSHYVIGLQQALHKIGWNSVAMNFRGCSGEPNLLPRGYHSGDTNDLTFIINHLEQKTPYLKIAVIGFSLGGNVLLKWLGEAQQNRSVIASVAVSVPFQLDLCAKQMNQGFAKVYRNFFLRDLIQYIEIKKSSFIAQGATEYHKALSTLGNIKRYKTFWDFDHNVTAPLHGFSGAADYYRRSSSKHYLSAINCPTLIIHSLDDPLISTACLPKEQDLSEFTELELTTTGGHVGFIGGEHPMKPNYYLEQRIPQFLEEF
ncbi:hydrolase [Endozoicomonas sp. SM1973]|uniref:Hydrolase n=1 Tax=Spartinivicinus marinus TaxID=2994442 RepID=A0A853I5F4_9GAMM|nr:hydrolase [Spartinivicinus marinus]MCX4027094.1 hydrolase [Spartinivicinus marinus]NYZ68573.1 hydrolase [Spartinivicinus marinus]